MKIKTFNESFANNDFSNTIITLSIADDWSGLYIDGKLATEDHNLRLDETIKKMIELKLDLTNYKYTSFTMYKDGNYEDWLTEDEFNEALTGNCPEYLQDYVDAITKFGYTYEI